MLIFCIDYHGSQDDRVFAVPDRDREDAYYSMRPVHIPGMTVYTIYVGF